LVGGNDRDTYNGGGGSDFLHEGDPAHNPLSGNDVMNGGGADDFIIGNMGNDIIRGQEGNDRDEGAFFAILFGEEGDDEIYGGPGEDGLAGQQGTDKHFGGRNADFIDAVSQDEFGTQDLVDCGSGFDTAVVREPEDIVRANCEDRTVVTTVAAAPGTTNDQEQQQQQEAFVQENGLQP
jgi:hypothetical protein